MIDAPALATIPLRVVPTRETYSELKQAYEHFSQRLFDDALPHCLITLQREKRTCGYFSAARFASLDGSTTDEIALNPAYFAAVPIIETLQTLVHETDLPPSAIPISRKSGLKLT